MILGLIPIKREAVNLMLETGACMEMFFPFGSLYPTNLESVVWSLSRSSSQALDTHGRRQSIEERGTGRFSGTTSPNICSRGQYPGISLVMQVASVHAPRTPLPPRTLHRNRSRGSTAFVAIETTKLQLARVPQPAVTLRAERPDRRLLHSQRLAGSGHPRKHLKTTRNRRTVHIHCQIP